MSDFIKSDYCRECGGDGYLTDGHHPETGLDKFIQCEECERLHSLEVRADRLMDEMKEGSA